MNKTAIRKFAQWARERLIDDIKYKAGTIGITENGIAEKLPQSTDDLHFFDIGTKDYAEVAGTQIQQRNALVNTIMSRKDSLKSYEKAFENVVEEVAYTWFNRLIAIRFMEVNDYLPSGIRVLSSLNKAKNEPDFVTNPFDTDLEFTPYEQDEIIRLKDENKLDELFRMLFIKQCNKFHEILPELFETTDDYTELLLTISFTDTDGVVYHLVHDIDEDDFKDQVQIIGWLYQFYNSQLKDETYALLNKKVKLTKDRIPAVTQLFTPDWIVRYMVENSLGRAYINDKCSANENQSEDERINLEKDAAKNLNWKYYLPEAKQTNEVRAEISKLNSERFSPDTVKFIDPCMGSGHILVYAFDVFMEIYLERGWSEREAARSIVENNLFGVDIDDRAYQLAYFAVMMKGRSYDKRFLTRKIKPNLISIKESNPFVEINLPGDEEANETLAYVINTFRDAKEYGSILNVEDRDYDALLDILNDFKDNNSGLTTSVVSLYLNIENIKALVEQAKILSTKYDVVVTNPPYMAPTPVQKPFIEKNYPDSKTDLFAVFIEKCAKMTKKNGFYSLITMNSWMFLSSFEKLRSKLMLSDTINMIHLGARAFDEIGGEVVQTTAFVRRKASIENYEAVYCRLIEPKSENGKREMFLSGENRYTALQENFRKIPGSPIAYWVSEKILEAYNSKTVSEYMDCKSGIMTGSDKYVKLWHETSINSIKFDCQSYLDMEDYKWFPLNSGGGFRKWYGNNTKIVNLQFGGAEIKRNVKNYRLRDKSYYFKQGITWGRITSSEIAFREAIKGSLFGDAGPVGFINEYRHYLLAFLSSNVAKDLLQITNPTLNFQVHDIIDLPLIINSAKIEQINKTVSDNISKSKSDWDSYETSWDFKRNPLI